MRLSQEDKRLVEIYLSGVSDMLRKTELDIEFEEKLDGLSDGLVGMDEDLNFIVKSCAHEQNCGSIVTHVESLIDEWLQEQ